ncbi:MAG: T9SS type A sorting domain-containing protein [Saprospiraceae bacterium]|nr:T9SS type A sorting domain-containing protein [Saprospiraceae bacterium]
MRQIILYLLAAAAVLISREVNAQDCPNFTLTFNRQSALDSFPIKYPQCRENRFTIVVTGDDITDLTPLAQIKRFNSNLRVENCGNLESLALFDSTYYMVKLELNNVTKLKNLKGLEKVQEIYSLRIHKNNSLESLEGLEGLKKCPEDIFIRENPLLQKIDNFPLKDTLQGVTIGSNPQLRYVNLWDSLKVVRASLEIQDNPRLKNLDGLKNLVRVGNTLRIDQIDSIEYLPDFEHLEFVGTNLYIIGRDQAPRRNLCKNIPLFPKLRTVGKAILISNFIYNEIEDYDGFNALEQAGSISLFSLATRNISGFNNLKSVSGRIFIDGYSNLYDKYLEEISGFNRIETVGEIYLKSNVELKKFTGFRNLRRVETDLDLYGASLNLETFEGLANLEYVGKKCKFNLNRSLSSLGVKNLKYVGGNFWLDNAERLKNLDELATLTTVKGEIYIFHNDILEDITGLSNIDYRDVTEINFRANPKTSFCGIKLFCDYLKYKPNSPFIVGQGNGPGCNTREEILEQCRLVSTTDMREDSDIVIYPNPAATELYIQVPAEVQVREMRIYDGSGRQVHQDRVREGKVDISRLTAGMYQAMMLTESGRIIQRRLVVLK